MLRQNEQGYSMEVEQWTAPENKEGSQHKRKPDHLPRFPFFRGELLNFGGVAFFTHPKKSTWLAGKLIHLMYILLNMVDFPASHVRTYRDVSSLQHYGFWITHWIGSWSFFISYLMVMFKCQGQSTREIEDLKWPSLSERFRTVLECEVSLAESVRKHGAPNTALKWSF